MLPDCIVTLEPSLAAANPTSDYTTRNTVASQVPAPSGPALYTTQGEGRFGEWTNPNDSSTWVFVANSSGTSALQVTYDSLGNPTLTLKWKIAAPGTTPHFANNVLYIASGGSHGVVEIPLDRFAESRFLPCNPKWTTRAFAIKD